MSSRGAWALISAGCTTVYELAQRLDYGADPRALYRMHNVGKKTTDRILRVLWDNGYITLRMLPHQHKEAQ